MAFDFGIECLSTQAQRRKNSLGASRRHFEYHSLSIWWKPLEDTTFLFAVTAEGKGRDDDSMELKESCW